MVVSIRKLLITIIMYGLFIRQLYSYVGIPYSADPGSYAWQQLPAGNSLTVALEIIVLACLVMLILHEFSFFTYCTTRTYILIFLCLSMGIFYWTFLTALDIGLVEMLYSTTAPFVYLTGLCVCIGADVESYQYFLTHAKLIGTISLILSIVAYVLFLRTHPTGVLANSSVLVLYIQAFWLLCICSFGGGHSRSSTVYLEICIAGILAVLFNSRSWIIQTIIWLLSYAYCQDKRKGLVKVLKILALVMIMAVVVYNIINSLYPDILTHLINKPSVSDTRSAQYTDLFRQTHLTDFLFGRGYTFQYQSSLQGGLYSYIDNTYILILIRYGFSIGLMYPLMFIYPVVRRKYHKDVIPVLMWLAALGGLSIYCAPTLDLKSIALAVIAGHCLQQREYKEESEEHSVKC